MRVAIIGARNIPDWLSSQIESYTEGLVMGLLDSGEEVTVVTGGAPGTDQAAIRGAMTAGAHVTVHLPWATFEEIALSQVGDLRVSQDENEFFFRQYLEEFYGKPSWEMKPSTVRLMARNNSIIKDSTRVIAFPRYLDEEPTGGTSFGIFLAKKMFKMVTEYPIHTFQKWDICPECGILRTLGDCGARYHSLKAYA